MRPRTNVRSSAEIFVWPSRSHSVVGFVRRCFASSRVNSRSFSQLATYFDMARSWISMRMVSIPGGAGRSRGVAGMVTIRARSSACCACIRSFACATAASRHMHCAQPIDYTVTAHGTAIRRPDTPGAHSALKTQFHCPQREPAMDTCDLAVLQRAVRFENMRAGNSRARALYAFN